MKRLIVGLMALMMIACMVPVAMADTIEAGDWVNLRTFNSIGGGGIMVFNVADSNGGPTEFTLTTFCIQDGVRISDHTWYEVASVSKNIGPFAPPATGDGPLNGAVDYLFFKYTGGAYNTEFSGGDGLADQADFQKLLWSLQGEIAPFTPEAGSPWSTDLTAYQNNLNLHFDHGTEVVNLFKLDGETPVDVQNVLTNVPEPASMLLLGLGLLGLGGLRRKFRK